MKIKCFFSHPFVTRGTEEEKRIIDILKDRRVEVLNPFTGKDDLNKKYNVKEYKPTMPYKMGREIWTRDLIELDSCNMALFWLPEGPILVGVYAEIQHAVEYQNRVMRKNRFLKEEEQEPYFIQIITKKHQPLIAWALCYGNQLYDDIDNFERYRQTRW